MFDGRRRQILKTLISLLPPAKAFFVRKSKSYATERLNMTKTCEYCGRTIEGTARRKYCDAQCRAKAAKRREAPAEVVKVDGENVKAVERLVAELEGSGLARYVQGPVVQAARSLAAQVDAAPADSPLWGRYLAALENLRSAADTAENEAVDHLAAGFRYASWTEAERVRRYAEAPPEEKSRFDRFVPVGCARGDHAWFRWPAGKVTCSDCGAEGE